MGVYSEIAQGLKDYAVKTGGKASLMRKLEAKKATFYRALDDEAPVLPSPDVLCEWLDKMDVQVLFPDEEMADFVMVSKAKAVAGAGGSLETDEGSTGLYAFRREFLMREHIHTADLRMMLIRGDSMEPTIKDGDTVLVDQTDKKLMDGRIFIIGVDEELMCKRAAKIPGGWRFCSENKERPDIDVTGDELERLRVYGRVRWFGRVLA